MGTLLGSLGAWWKVGWTLRAGVVYVFGKIQSLSPGTRKGRLGDELKIEEVTIPTVRQAVLEDTPLLACPLAGLDVHCSLDLVLQNTSSPPVGVLVKIEPLTRPP
jgi:hypothetical protein